MAWEGEIEVYGSACRDYAQRGKTLRWLLVVSDNIE